MNRLIKAGTIKVVPDGSPSRKLNKLVPQGYEEPAATAAAKPTANDMAMMALEQAILGLGADGKVTVEQWRTAAYAAGISKAEDAEARRQAFHRARKALAKEGRIGTDGDYVWPVGA
jgi:hypothetical protein